MHACGRIPATAACFAPLVRCRVRRSKREALTVVRQRIRSRRRSGSGAHREESDPIVDGAHVPDRRLGCVWGDSCRALLRRHAAHCRRTRRYWAKCDAQGRDSLAHHVAVPRRRDMGILAGLSHAPEPGTHGHRTCGRCIASTWSDRRAWFSGYADDLWRRDPAGRGNDLEHRIQKTLHYGRTVMRSAHREP